EHREEQDEREGGRAPWTPPSERDRSGDDGERRPWQSWHLGGRRKRPAWQIVSLATPITSPGPGGDLRGDLGPGLEWRMCPCQPAGAEDPEHSEREEQRDEEPAPRHGKHGNDS